MTLDRTFEVAFAHRLRFTQGAFDAGNQTLASLLEGDQGRRARVLFVLDQGLSQAAPDLAPAVDAFLARNSDSIEAAAPTLSIPGGETCKNDRDVLDRVLAAMHQARLCRRSYIVVVGGGAVLDVVGFAAAVFHRGIRLVRVPSTTLAQADSGVGVKSAVNAFGAKNLIGAFSPPWAVVNDERLLESLSDEHWRDGFSEAVKVALLKDAPLYDRIKAAAPRLLARDMAAAAPVIRRSAALHMEHITLGGDPFEFRHARPLDFGHWAAHKLEQMTSWELSHGFAVSIGVALDSVYAELLGESPAGLSTDVAACLHALGLPTWHPALERTDELLAGLEEFREHLGGRLTITLVRRPGEAFDVHEMSPALLTQSIARLRETRRDAVAPDAA